MLLFFVDLDRSHVHCLLFGGERNSTINQSRYSKDDQENSGNFHSVPFKKLCVRAYLSVAE